MQTTQRGTVRGTVHAPGPCVVQVRWYAADGRCLGRRRVYAGPFRLVLPVGRYFLEVADERAASDPSRVETAVVAIVVRDEYVAEVDVRLTRDTAASPARPQRPAPRPCGVLECRVVDGADPTRPLSGARLRLLDRHGRLVARARSDAGGRVAFEGLASAADLELVVRPAPASHDHLAHRRGGITVADGQWHDLGDLALAVDDRPQRAPRLRSATAQYGSNAAVMLARTRV
ncbi:MSCRAMM family protein [Nocardioides dongkuii]|uniref:MSCRAMM family protein n=1 Tax=Nocardioides dongkuii TaxID=2760089 RepID=UPI0015F7E7B0|nr:hypothetical protein [Nocardioides dongkuii]